MTTAGEKKWPADWPAESPPVTSSAPAATAASTCAATLSRWFAEAIGPMSVEGSSGSPTHSVFVWSTNADRKSSYTSRCT